MGGQTAKPDCFLFNKFTKHIPKDAHCLQQCYNCDTPVVVSMPKRSKQHTETTKQQQIPTVSLESDTSIVKIGSALMGAKRCPTGLLFFKERP